MTPQPITLNSISSLVHGIHKQSIEKGFWEEINSDDRQCCLIVSELMEAIQAHRKDKYACLTQFSYDCAKVEEIDIASFELNLKDSLEVELADAWIRIADWHYWLIQQGNDVMPFMQVNSIDIEVDASFESDIASICDEVLAIRKSDKYLNFARHSIELLCEKMEIDLLYFVRAKTMYNATRPKYHHKKY